MEGRSMRKKTVQYVIFVSALMLVFSFGCQEGKNTEPPLTFGVSFSAEQSAEALDGRILLMISTDDGREPRFQISDGPNTQQIFGIDVDGLPPGQEAVFDAKVFGFPKTTLADIPPGEYTVQALLHVYETFTRSDGHTVKLPMDRGEGQHWNRAPGNLHSTPQKIHIDPLQNKTISLALDQKIPPSPIPRKLNT